VVPILWSRIMQCCGTVTFYYGSGSNFWKIMVPVPTFEKVTVPVPVPAPYLDHKKQIFIKKSLKSFWLLTGKLFYKEKVHKFQQIYGKMSMKKCFMKEIKYIILCLVPVPEP